MIRAFDTILRDTRYAVLSLRRSPLFILTVAATIALGLGINTALFTLFNAYVLRPIAVRDPYNLYTLTSTTRAGQAHAFTWEEYQRLTEDPVAFSEVAAVMGVQTRLDGRVVQGQLATGNYFQMLGVGTALGRTLLPEDAAAPGRDPVVVLSYEAWRTIFAGRPDIVGTKIMLRGSPMEVIGVARKGFQDLTEVPRDFWAPITMAVRLQDGPDLFGPEHPERLTIIGRIHPGQSIASAEATLTQLRRQMTSGQGAERRAVRVLLRSNATTIPLTAELLVTISPLAGAFALALLLACANVACMMLARAAARQREMGVRLSLGAGRGRLISQLLTESILLAVPAAFLGWIVSRVAIEASLRTMYATVPKDMLELLHEVTLPSDWRVVVFMFAAGVTSAVLFGLAPAVWATRQDVMVAARGAFTSNLGPTRFRNGLVFGQITTCTLLLVACGALLRTTVAADTSDIGFQTDGLIAMQVVETARRPIFDALAANSAVDAVTAASSIPLNGLVPSVSIITESGSSIGTAYNYVSPTYFEMLRIPIQRGRNFTAAEAVSEAAVAIVTAATAFRLFGSDDPIGQTIQLAAKPVRNVRIVGVAADIVTCCIAYGKDASLIYLPSGASTKGALLVHVRGEVETERRVLDARLARLVPGGVSDIHSLDQFRAGSVYPFRAASLIGLAVGALALLLTMSGVYGTVSYLVTQRTKEIGIRVALGATARTVTTLVLNQSLRVATIAVGLGAGLAIVLSRVLARIVFMRVFDAQACAAGVLLVAAAALVAGYIPSRRAARVDPMQTLRGD